MRSFTRALAGLGMAACLLAPATSMAFGNGTPDESPPAEEAVCEEAGLMGSALGLCIAFCEANDCDTHPKAKACAKLRGNYARITGELALPCELVEPPEEFYPTPASTPVGSYPGSPSPSGTFDQGGNAADPLKPKAVANNDSNT